MVFTHLPSSLLLILVPLMPNVQSAIAMLFLRRGLRICVNMDTLGPLGLGELSASSFEKSFYHLIPMKVRRYGPRASITTTRFSISQMDVVPRQSYVSGIVMPEERTTTMGITNIVRSLGAACGPLITGYLSEVSGC